MCVARASDAASRTRTFLGIGVLGIPDFAYSIESSALPVKRRWPAPSNIFTCGVAESQCTETWLAAFMPWSNDSARIAVISASV